MFMCVYMPDNVLCDALTKICLNFFVSCCLPVREHTPYYKNDRASDCSLLLLFSQKIYGSWELGSLDFRVMSEKNILKYVFIYLFIFNQYNILK